MPQRHWSPYEKTQLARAGLSDLVHSVENNVPVEYLTHQVNFSDLTFKVSPMVLIPRVETEALVDFSVAEIENLLLQNSVIHIVEVGTGSGAIGLSLWQKITAKNLRNRCEITLLDISETALHVAKENKQQLFPNDPHIQIKQMDLLCDWPVTAKIDLLIANLPYIPTANIAKLDSSVKDFEPHLALDGGPDGLVLIKKLLQQAVSCLTTNGVIWLEVDDTHTLEKLQNFGLPFQYEIALDCFHKPRFIKVVRS